MIISQSKTFVLSIHFLKETNQPNNQFSCPEYLDYKYLNEALQTLMETVYEKKCTLNIN